MEILNLTLKNFKGHEERYFEFSQGTNAICGENGAGKTSILEAIAWVLFDHCDYQKKELIRSGARSAHATVEFLSSLDGRCYRVKRNTQRGYEIFDPQLNAKLNVKKREDVQQWLCEHLGVPRNTELSRLFAETIGIPQGTFTADFLKRPGDRKKIFDPILKVEDYKQTYDRTRNLETRAKTFVTQLEQKLEMATVQLADWDDLKTEFKTLTTEIEADQNRIGQLQAEVTTHQIELAALQAIAQDIEGLNQQQQLLERDRIRQESEWTQTRQRLGQAEDSAQICAAHQAAYTQYTQTQTSLVQLQGKRDQYQMMLAAQADLTQKLTAAQVKQAALVAQLDGFVQLEAQIQDLSPLVAQQEKLEQQCRQVHGEMQALKVNEGQIQTYTAQIQRLKAQKQALDSEINTSQAEHHEISQLPALEQEKQQVMQAMSHWEVTQDWFGKLEPIFTQGKADRDRHRSAVQRALKQIAALSNLDLKDIEATLKEGAIINTGMLKAMHQLLQELEESASPDRLQQKLQQLTVKIQRLHQVQSQMALLESKRQQRQETERQISELQIQLETAQTQIQAFPTLLADQREFESALATLNNPKAQIILLQRQLQQKTSLERQSIQNSEQLSDLEQQQRKLKQTLEPLQSLDQEFKQAQSEINQCQSGYQLYLQHQNNAAQVAPLTAALETLKTQRVQTQEKLAQLHSQKIALVESLDLDRLQFLQSQVQGHQVLLGQLQGGLIPKKQRLQQLQSQLEQRQAMFDQRERDRQRLGQKKEIYDFIQEARRIYSQSGPRISELYQQEISLEADRLFRELLHRQDVALRWTEDYDIQVQEGGHWRTFKSLSGGEQMCGALAVRLALLKTLADINVAFFDEPTTNMDGMRRSQLAEAISNLKSFHQLFVISHDDTFEAITESIIRLDPKQI